LISVNVSPGIPLPLASPSSTTSDDTNRTFSWKIPPGVPSSIVPSPKTCANSSCVPDAPSAPGGPGGPGGPAGPGALFCPGGPSGPLGPTAPGRPCGPRTRGILATSLFTMLRACALESPCALAVSVYAPVSASVIATVLMVRLFTLRFLFCRPTVTVLLV
jgi:hypothetical protein